MTGSVNSTIDKDTSTAIIEFFHPKGNSLPSSLLQEIASEILNFGSDNSVKSILVRSKGDKVFCSGASFDELLTISDEKSGEMFFRGFADVINAIRKVPKFVIGEVQGKTVGGGVGLAAAFDYCLATSSASIKLSELSIGIGPFVIAPALERKIGVSALSELSIDATNWRSSNWAKEKGMFHEVYETKLEMQEASNNLLKSISNYSSEAISEMKNILWKDFRNWDKLLIENAKISGKLVLSEFTKSKLEEFKK